MTDLNRKSRKCQRGDAFQRSLAAVWRGPALGSRSRLLYNPTMEKVELLAPARDLRCGQVAVDCGADAVYVGAPRFGARQRVGNSLEDIAALVAHAHTYWARVYVTVNTLLFDDELPQAVRLIHELYELGVDAVIIQDVGLLECDLPPIVLIASTQMHNHTPERVAFLEEMGFRRAILARELSLEQIRAIRARTSLELEFFVHGALCTGYSGQCTLSYAIGGRSGNRGECAQPCRRRYSLVDGDGQVLVPPRHLLSLRDLALGAELGELLDAGITSFKIEGRLKDEVYVANVVAWYRRELDGALAARGRPRSSSGQGRPAFEPDLDKTFNRGYTAYLVHGRGEPPGALDSPKMVGELLGNVVAVEGANFLLETAVPLHGGDGLCWFGPGQDLEGTVVNAVQPAAAGRLRVTPEKMGGIRPGLPLYRNHDHAFLRQVSAAL
ncbi:MAG: U32 family peptidase, partial [Chloroflexi bacterium]